MYKLIFYQLQKNNRIEESEKIFSKIILPIHQKFSNHITLFKKYPLLTLEVKINIYTHKILKNLENAKNLCEKEEAIDIDGEKLNEELELKSIDLDYETIHSEILENIIFDENDSGLSDLDTIEIGEDQQKKIFEITKIKTIVHQSVKSLFAESQEIEQFKPLLYQEKENKNEKIITKEKIKEKDYENNNNKETINKITEIIKKEIKDNENTSEDRTTDVISEKKKDIINFKKFNILTDPYSNYNSFTKKYTIEKKAKKRFRDIHPFLKNFNPKFLKKENIDKKIFRRFRKFVKSLYKENNNSPIFSKNVLFWKKFNSQNLLPPVKIKEDNGELIEHKSFNCQYLIWLFSQEGTIELFKLFTKEESVNLINDFIKEYNLDPEKESNKSNDIDKLKHYIEYIPEIYDYYNMNKNNNNDNNNKITLDENKEIIDTFIMFF